MQKVDSEVLQFACLKLTIDSKNRIRSYIYTELTNCFIRFPSTSYNKKNVKKLQHVKSCCV